MLHSILKNSKSILLGSVLLAGVSLPAFSTAAGSNTCVYNDLLGSPWQATASFKNISNQFTSLSSQMNWGGIYIGTGTAVAPRQSTVTVGFSMGGKVHTFAPNAGANWNDLGNACSTKNCVYAAL